MPEYIEREALKKRLACSPLFLLIRDVMFPMKEAVLDLVDKQPAADVAEVRHGYWKDVYGNKYINHLYECSVCGEKAPYRMRANELGNIVFEQELTKGCPHCLAKMDGKGE